MMRTKAEAQMTAESSKRKAEKMKRTKAEAKKHTKTRKGKSLRILSHLVKLRETA